MQRRRFLELAGLGACSSLIGKELQALPHRSADVSASVSNGSDAGNAYGSGHFGQWTRDEFGLPAYRYTCNQLKDARAISPVNRAWRDATDHTHQVGNDRIVAAVSNYGYVQARQDEGSPKFLNDYFPQQHRYGGGVGFLRGDDFVLSTYYSGAAESFDRIFGMGYLRKRVRGHEHAIDQVIFAPHGDDPVLLSQVTITNHSTRAADLRWVEYWGCEQYQFSYRSLMEAAILGSADATPQMRRDFCSRFEHRFATIKGDIGLMDTQTYRGPFPQEEDSWRRLQTALKENPTTYFGGPVPDLAAGASMEDIHPPATFLVSLDAPAYDFASNAVKFFEGGIERPSGMDKRLNSDLSATGTESAFFLERRIALQAGESRTVYFLYGYLPEGFALDALVSRYSTNPSSHWPRSCAQWKVSGLSFHTDAEPWVEREVAWSGYYLRSGLTYDSFFREHILSQGSGTQYVAGIQGAARDPLQHVLPLIFTDPEIVRQILRYTLKEIQPDGSLPYGIVGCGVPMPCQYRPSDLQLYVLWVLAEYVLATRDSAFLLERVPVYPKRTAEATDRTVLELAIRSYTFLKDDVGTGEHGLLRSLNGDWNDSIVINRLPPDEVAEATREGESVLNAGMACYVLDHFARMLEWVDRGELAAEARTEAEAQRRAMRAQWTGRWYRRCWLGRRVGWDGEEQLWLEPQPWALLGDVGTPDRAKTLIASIDQLLRKPSPIGALLQNQAVPTMKDDPGVGTNGGIFAAVNGTLIWALAQADGTMAWDEWKKNTLACHAEAYPDLWYGIWSGPDAYNSVLAKSPGATGADAPVMNMHSHAWPLYSLIKLLGLEFTTRGLRLRPVLPLPEYEFASPLLGLQKDKSGYAGWYAPAAAGRWEIELTLPDPKRDVPRRLTVNGATQDAQVAGHSLRFSGGSKPGAPLAWQISLR